MPSIIAATALVFELPFLLSFCLWLKNDDLFSGGYFLGYVGSFVSFFFAAGYAVAFKSTRLAIWSLAFLMLGVCQFLLSAYSHTGCAIPYNKAIDRT